MPATSIDTFFACALVVSVVVASIAALSGILGAQINSVQDLNQDEYFRALSENMLWNPGTPTNWGMISSAVPQTLGLAEQNSLLANELDADKICRLNDQNAFSLTYLDILGAARLKNVALGISVSQLLDISVSLFSNSTLGDVTAYTFSVFVGQDGIPVEASLHCYAIARNFETDVYETTFSDGLGRVSLELPTASNGTALLVTFARASYDSRITAFETYPFEHLSSENQTDNTLLSLSPLDYTLYLNQNLSNIPGVNGYAFSYGYETSLSATSNSTYAIPTLLEPSPIVLVICGSNNSTSFIESTSYPEVPFDVGANFQSTECHEFSFLVIIRGALYRMTLGFGRVNP